MASTKAAGDRDANDKRRGVDPSRIPLTSAILALTLLVATGVIWLNPGQGWAGPPSPTGTPPPSATPTDVPTISATPPPTSTSGPTPTAPKNLQAIVVQDQLLIQLFWETNHTLFEIAYIVERSVVGTDGPWTLIAILPPNWSMYEDGGLTDGVTYWYRVAAEGSAARSDYSNIVFGTATQLPTPPVGDADCSGSVTSIDAALVLQLSAGLVASLSCQEFADANEDGELNSIDAALILQFVAGLLSNLPP